MNIPNSGKVIKDGDRASIEFERVYPHAIEDVWAALTNPEELAGWFGHVRLEAKEGGEIVVEAGPERIPVEHRRSVGRILVWQPPQVIEYEWRQAVVEESTLRFELKSQGTSTLLKLTHRWLSVRNASGFNPGWHAYLDRLAAQLAGDAVPDWEARYGELMPAYCGWTA
jgi:uncharacterized protein YndB with AHSA1/START domain